MGPWIGFSHNAPSLLQEIEKAKQQWRGGGGGGALKMGGMMLACPEVCLPTVNRGEFSLGAALTPSLPCTPQPNLCYRDLHSALLLDPKHPQAKVLLQVMVGQAEQARQDAGVLAVQGKLQHALQCINCAIENNPLDPSFFLFRYWVGKCCLGSQALPCLRCAV